MVLLLLRVGSKPIIIKEEETLLPNFLWSLDQLFDLIKAPSEHINARKTTFLPLSASVKDVPDDLERYSQTLLDYNREKKNLPFSR